MVNLGRLSIVLWYLTFFIFLGFVGFRLEVGPDWQQYRYIHQSLAYFNFWEVIDQAEPLSYLLFWTSQRTVDGVYLSNIVASFIMLTGVFCFARRTANPWLALVAATPYFIMVMGMSGMRQTIAAGIILFLFSRWETRSFIRRGIYILIAALFHTSALVNNLFLIIKLNIRLRYKLMFGGVILLATLYLGTAVPIYADNIARYQQRYLEGNFIDLSLGSIYHIAMIFVPAVLGFIYRKRMADTVYNPSLLSFGLYASLTILFINLFYPTVASRLTVYLYFLPMMVYPALVVTFGRRAQMISIFAVITFHMVILMTWFLFGNHAFAYIPYKNILFDVPSV
ncbi:MAG: EpsG family protein [Alphaproteobacteria bacterium]|nr:EpsG family protein [Alphaproteobacteria bacterium]